MEGGCVGVAARKDCTWQRGGRNVVQEGYFVLHIYLCISKGRTEMISVCYKGIESGMGGIGMLV